MRAPVLHVIPHLWSGAGGVVTRLCEAQRRHGPVAIVTAGQRGDHPDWPAYRTRLRRVGVAHHTLDFFHRDEGFWLRVSQLATLVGRLKPAVIHAHAGVPACAAVIARAVSGHDARVIGQMYSWGPDRPAWMNVQDAWGFGQTDRVVCSARAYRTLLARAGVSERKLVYLPWGLPLDGLPYRGDGRRPAHPPTLGFVGRIEPRKGQLELVRAFARIRTVRPDARLVLVGPTADAAYGLRVRDAIGRLGLRRAVTMTGAVRDVVKYLNEWDLFVSLSSDEGQGLAVLEAMAVGVPVLARPVAGIDDFLIDGRTGFTIRGASRLATASAIEAALSSPARAHATARRARQLVERRYAWARTVQAFDRLYWR